MSEYIVKIEEPISPLFYERQLKEIVRCRDCEHTEESESGSLYCIGYLVEKWDYYNDEPSYGRKVESDGFCAWGERRES